MEDFVTEEQEERLMVLVASEFCAGWELPLVELGLKAGILEECIVGEAVL